MNQCLSVYSTHTFAILKSFNSIFLIVDKISTPQTSTKSRPQTPKELEKKLINKVVSEPQKRSQKRTRGSMSIESNSSPSTTPPPTNNKRRRI